MIHSHDDQTIIAQCTPQGSGALALLRLSGSDVFTIADKVAYLPQNKKVSQAKSHTIEYGYIIDEQGKHIDQVLFLVMHAPRTFTGQHTVEITCHNNPFIIEAIIKRAIQVGARIAQNGEFTKRAVMNNKIDVLQAEAINELIHANTQMALKKSLAQIEGSFSHWLQAIEQQLVKALALSEASFEFIDEEDMEFNTQIEQIINTTFATTNKLKKAFDQQQHIRQGIRIAIIGSVNAGKSSLFNALLGKDRAIVTNIAGTTRDVIEAGLYKNGNYWTLIDTAGLRQTNDTIEQEGIKRSFEQAKQADIVLLVFDASRTLTDQEQDVYTKLLKEHKNKIIAVYSKTDLPQKNNFAVDNAICISTTQSTTIEQVEKTIQEKINKFFANIDSPFLLNQRQFNILLGLEQKLQTLKPMLHGDVQYELVSYHLQDALEHIAQLTGKSISEAGMDAVFREFCVGK